MHYKVYLTKEETEEVTKHKLFTMSIFRIDGNYIHFTNVSLMDTILYELNIDNDYEETEQCFLCL